MAQRNGIELKDLFPRLVCKDGVSLSVQASESTYCEPRTNIGPYTEVEVGFIRDANDQPVTPPVSWERYGDGKFPSDVYGYVPTQLVEHFIAEHGGIDIGLTLDNRHGIHNIPSMKPKDWKDLADEEWLG